jgi:hypothetical protein
LQTVEYYSTQSIRGAGSGKFPDSGNATLLEQYVECLEKFWKSGSAIVWRCDNDPLFYELNLFLEIA